MRKERFQPMKQKNPQYRNNCTNSGTVARLPRLAMINSMAGFGRCSTTISLPVISTMKVQVCPVPTSVLSNHLGFPICHRNDYTPYMRDYLHAWKSLNIEFDGLYCGFLGNVEQIAIVEEFLDTFHPSTFLLDPVMGDHGRTYASITSEQCNRLKKLLPYTSILTPNITEACLLTDTPYKGNNLSEEELETLCRKLALSCPGSIVITGTEHENHIINAIWDKGIFSTHITPNAGRAHHGTGDLFASILIADALYGADFKTSVTKASDFVALCIRGSDEMGLPTQEGVPFEKFLSYLI